MPADDSSITDALHNLGKLVASISKEMQDIKRSNEELLQKVERLSYQQDESRRTIDVLLERERKREDKKKLRREQMGLAAQQNAQQEYRSWHNTLIGTTDPIGPPVYPAQSRQENLWSMPPMIYEPSLVQPQASLSPSSSPQDPSQFIPFPSIPDGHSSSAGRSSFSSELALLQSYSTPRLEVLLEARLVLPFLQYYPMPSRFPIPSWRFSLPSIHKHNDGIKLTCYLVQSFPVCTVTTNIREEDPPILSYANTAFLEVINRPWVIPPVPEHGNVSLPFVSGGDRGCAVDRHILCQPDSLQEYGSPHGEPVRLLSVPSPLLCLERRRLFSALQAADDLKRRVYI